MEHPRSIKALKVRDFETDEDVRFHAEACQDALSFFRVSRPRVLHVDYYASVVALCGPDATAEAYAVAFAGRGAAS